jgi:dTDP-glucose 4,6-dehydratase
MKLLVTGGCGFIGSNFVRHALEVRPDLEVTILDLLTYAGNLENLADRLDDPRLRFVKGDIADTETVAAAAQGVDAVVNFAAETHVDRSILDAAPFVRTNVVGTQTLLDVCRDLEVPRFLQVSTDEVYGSLGPRGRFTETSALTPNSPYSASKAAADLLVRAYVRSYGLPALILRSSNAYGPYQFPEKLIPLMIANIFAGESLPVYGDGQHVRDWVHVLDLCEAIWQVLERGAVGEIYNVGGGNELANLTLVRLLLQVAGGPETLIRFVQDRPGHDRRYAMDYGKIQQALGWRPRRDFQAGLRETVQWYAAHHAWVASVRSGEYRRYYERQYDRRLAAATAAPQAAWEVA